MDLEHTHSRAISSRVTTNYPKVEQTPKEKKLNQTNDDTGKVMHEHTSEGEPTTQFPILATEIKNS